jgi:hypothetical protein
MLRKTPVVPQILQMPGRLETLKTPADVTLLLLDMTELS